jgi:acyl-CoA hydrolase
VLVAFFCGGGDAVREDLLGFGGAGFAGKQLSVHQIGWDVVGIPLKESAKMRVGGCGVATVHAFHGESIAGEGVFGLPCDELFEHLPAGFLLFGHRVVSYYTGARDSLQTWIEMGMRMKRNKKNGDQEGRNLQGKLVSASRSEMTEIVLPAQTNPLGKLLGGQVMHLVDMAAALAAHRHSNCYVVTASVDYIDFRNPVNLGEIVTLTSQVNRVFHTSMEVGVEVYSENVLTGERRHTTTAYVTFVAIDEHTKKPKLVPPLIVKTAGEKRRYEEAAERRKTRLELRYGTDSSKSKSS